MNWVEITSLVFEKTGPVIFIFLILPTAFICAFFWQAANKYERIIQAVLADSKERESKFFELYRNQFTSLNDSIKRVESKVAG